MLSITIKLSGADGADVMNRHIVKPRKRKMLERLTYAVVPVLDQHREFQVIHSVTAQVRM